MNVNSTTYPTQVAVFHGAVRVCEALLFAVAVVVVSSLFEEGNTKMYAFFDTGSSRYGRRKAMVC